MDCHLPCSPNSILLERIGLRRLNYSEARKQHWVIHDLLIFTDIPVVSASQVTSLSTIGGFKRVVIPLAVSDRKSMAEPGIDMGARPMLN